jgi:hypothetical protein
VPQLGDTTGILAPIRRCVVVSYDGDRYCEIEIGEQPVRLHVNRVFLYSDEKRYGEAKAIQRLDLKRLPLKRRTP